MDVPWQTVAKPDIVPGWAGAVITDTIRVLAVLVPQVFVAVTDIVPPVVPAVAVIDVVLELPVHPDGNVQV